MNTYHSFDIIIVCCGYSDKLKPCLFFWKNQKYLKDKYRIIIITSTKDIETIQTVNEFKTDDVDMKILCINDLRYNNKGFMLKKYLQYFKNSMNDYVILSDSDIIFDQNFLIQMNLNILENNNTIFSSYREDIEQRDVSVFFSKYEKEKPDWPWLYLRKSIMYSSPFMGWFLCFKSNYMNNIDFNENHKGYDFVDWKIYGQLLSLGLLSKIIYFDNMPLHIFHGPKGINWKGINL